MRALLVRGPGEVALEDIAEPVVGDGEVLVRPLVSGLCGTDLEIVAGTIDAAPDPFVTEDDRVVHVGRVDGPRHDL